MLTMSLWFHKNHHNKMGVYCWYEFTPILEHRPYTELWHYTSDDYVLISCLHPCVGQMLQSKGERQIIHPEQFHPWAYIFSSGGHSIASSTMSLGFPSEGSQPWQPHNGIFNIALWIKTGNLRKVKEKASTADVGHSREWKELSSQLHIITYRCLNNWCVNKCTM